MNRIIVIATVLFLVCQAIVVTLGNKHRDERIKAVEFVCDPRPHISHSTFTCGTDGKSGCIFSGKHMTMKGFQVEHWHKADTDEVVLGKNPHLNKPKKTTIYNAEYYTIVPNVFSKPEDYNGFVLGQ